MISNQQRAHDLAIAATENILRNPSYLQSNKTKDFYKIYLTAYKEYLDSINSDFPETEISPKGQ
jgi:hypothetical protein